MLLQQDYNLWNNGKCR